MQKLESSKTLVFYESDPWYDRKAIVKKACKIQISVCFTCGQSYDTETKY